MANYNLESLDLPVLSGWRLKLFAAALIHPITRGFMLKGLIRPSGLLKFRNLVIEDPPTHDATVCYDKNNTAGDSEQPEPSKHQPSPGDRPRGSPYSTIGDYYRAYRTQQATPETVAEKVLNAIATSDKGAEPLCAFIACNRDDVMEQARAATQRIQTGDSLSIFDGVPVAIKDEVDQNPYPTTVGPSFLGATPATEDATVVNRLCAAG